MSNLTNMFEELSKTFNSSRNIHTFVQWKKRCSMVYEHNLHHKSHFEFEDPQPIPAQTSTVRIVLLFKDQDSADFVRTT